MQQRVLLLALFCSGAASLILENLWLEWLALHWGRTADASAALLSCFMLGLGLGQLWVLKLTNNPARPVTATRSLKLWAGCEVAVGVAAALCQWRFTQTSQPLGLAAIIWMLVPTVFMGMTLPFAVSALRQNQLTTTLGRAYACNTLGAAIGCLLAGFWLVKTLGLAQASMLAIALQLVAATLIATQLFKRVNDQGKPPARTSASATQCASKESSSQAASSRQVAFALLAVGVSGCFILGMEMLWFRALLLSHRSTAENFAIMLMVVLLGLALGSWLASHLSGPSTRHGRNSNLIALLLSSQVLVSCLGILLWQPDWHFSWPATGLLLAQAAILILPACLLSGALFVVAAQSLKPNNPSSATAKLVLFSTIGSTIGAPLIVLWGLPQIGWSNSLLMLLALLVIAASINAWRIGLATVAALLLLSTPLAKQWPQAQLAAASIYLQLDSASQPAQIIHQADGQYQTVQLLENRFLDQPISHRLMTDSYSMTSTATDSERYMRFFAWLPRALHSELQDVLLISYGAGSTAEALLDNPATQTLTIADPAAAILDASRHIKRAPEPLDDPRVRVQLADGRQVLGQSPAQFDLITGEPPPPRLAGMHSLYSAEYFSLMQRALKPGGLASYWLPVDQLTTSSSKAIIGAFCDAFPDCSLWAGSHYNWILLGSSTQAQPHPGHDNIGQLWADATTRSRLRESGFEHPAQLASSFIADHSDLQRWRANVAPLTDNWPRRIDSRWPNDTDIQLYAEWQDNNAAEQRYQQSTFAARWALAPDALALAWSLQPLLNGQFRPAPEQRMQVLWQVLQISDWQTPVLWLLGTDQQRVAIAQQSSEPTAKLHQAVGLLAARQYRLAADGFAELAAEYPLANALAGLAKALAERSTASK